MVMDEGSRGSLPAGKPPGVKSAFQKFDAME